MTSNGFRGVAELESSMLFAIQSEIECALHHREKNISKNNRVSATQQREALRTMGVHVDAIGLGLKNIANVFTRGLEVRHVINMSLKSPE